MRTVLSPTVGDHVHAWSGVQGRNVLSQVTHGYLDLSGKVTLEVTPVQNEEEASEAKGSAYVRSLRYREPDVHREYRKTVEARESQGSLGYCPVAVMGENTGDGVEGISKGSWYKAQTMDSKLA